MGILKVIGLTKAFGPDTVFEDVSFELQRGVKAGMIGANGTGKSTLLKVILGQEEADGGRVILPEGETLAYLQQESDFAQSGGTLFQELLSAYQDVLDMQQQMSRLEAVMSAETDSAVLEDLMKKYSLVTARFEHAGGYGYENNIRRVAAGLGFASEDLERRTTEFSGGQKTRIALARALLRRPDYLFLDEPTNHLDIAMVEWLEEYLREYAGGVLLVSHDRYFLDRVADRILELEDRRLTEYDGNYSRYLRQKAERLEAQLAAYDKQQAYIAKTEAFIERYRAGIKSKQARGRQSQLDRLERVDAPLENRSFAFAFTNLTESADRVAELENISAAYRERTIFKRQNLLIRRGDGVALIGPNGAGKTTLLKLFTGDLSPAEGRVKLGSRVKIGYFSQEHEGLNPRRQVIEEIMLDFGTNEERARGYLGMFLFSGDDVFKLVGELSGGEKARLALLKLMLAGPNFLIMDEPTNHLDIPAKEAVEAAILSYAGTYLIVSHDRYFLDKVADRVVELAGGALTEYSGNYSYYREKKVALEKEQEKIKPAVTEKPEKTTKPAAARRRPPDKAKMLQKMEQEIRALEVEVQCLEMKLNDPATYDNHELAKAMAEEYEAKKKQLDDKYEVWLECTETEE